MSSPATPAERTQILRDAWDKMFKDPEFNDELKRRNWEAGPIGGDELQSLAKEIVN